VVSEKYFDASVVIAFMRAVMAAAQLVAEGIHATVVDPRCLVPFDDAAVVSSLETTSRLLVVQEGPADGGWGASLISRIVTNHFELFDAAPGLLASPACPVPKRVRLGPSA
jgi:pyruvate/2-oxoglutarate/acetoin dehydrogenase E1 component